MGRTSDAKPRLLAAAGELFQDKGYHAVGIQEICDAAGVNKGSFYYFFSSKRDLVLAAIDAQVEMYQQELMQPAFSSNVPSATQLSILHGVLFWELDARAKHPRRTCSG